MKKALLRFSFPQPLALCLLFGWICLGYAPDADAQHQPAEPAVIPGITFVKFKSSVRAGAVLLSWSTAQEYHTRHFEVLFSSTGTTFHSLGRVTATGNATTSSSYSFRDPKYPTYRGTVYYKIRLIDAIGASADTPVQAVNGPAAVQLQIQAFPSPFGQQLRVQVSTAETGVAALSLTAATGEVAWTQSLLLAAGTSTLQAAPAVLPGMYWLRLQQSSQVQVLRVICQ